MSTAGQVEHQLTCVADDERAALAEIERLTQELAQTRKDKLEKAQLEIQTLRIKNEQLQSEQNRLTDELLTKYVEIDELKEELAKMREKSAYDLDEATTKIQTQEEKMEKLLKELDIFTWTINTVEEKLKESNRQMQLSAQRHENDIKKYSEAVRARDATIKELDDNSADLEKQLTEIKRSLVLSEKLVAESQLKNECHQREIEDYKTMLEKYIAEVYSQTETIRLIQESNIAQSRSLTRFHDEVVRLTKEKIKNEQLQSEQNRLTDELLTKNVEIDELKKELAKTRKKSAYDLDEATTKIQTQVEKMEKLLKQLTEIKRSLILSEKIVAESQLKNKCHQREIEDYKTMLEKYIAEVYSLTETIRLIQEENIAQSRSLTKFHDEVARLNLDKEKLSKLASANLTHNHLNIVVLSDPYRLTKLSEAFSELFDNEWTDAFEGIKDCHERNSLNSLLTMLQASTDLGGTFSHLSLKYSRGSKEKAIHISQSRPAEARNEQRDTSETIIDDKSKAFPEHDKNVKSDRDAIGDTGSTILNMPTYVDMAIQVDVDEIEEGTYVATVSFDSDKLNPYEKQTIKHIRKRVLRDLKDQIIPMIANAVVEELHLHDCDDSIFTYVKSCASICWEMRIHQPPVYLDFEVADDRTLFNTAIYKYYTKSGPHVDYVVWPAMYLNEGGPLLSKGLAQGK